MSSSVTAWMRNMTVGAWVPLAGSPAAQNLSLSFEADGDAFRLSLSLHA
jgi:hypothetical protein